MTFSVLIFVCITFFFSFLIWFREHNNEAKHYATDGVQQMFNNADYWTDLEEMVQRTEDFKESLLLFQNDGTRANLADVFERYSILAEKYANDAEKLAFINKTWDDLSSDLHASCMLLDWRKHGSRYMTEEDRKDGLKGIKKYFRYNANDTDGNLYQQFEEHYLHYEAKNGIFEQRQFSKMNSNTSLEEVLNVYRGLAFRYQFNFWGLFFAVAEDICRKRVFCFIFVFYLSLIIVLHLLILFRVGFVFVCVA